MHSFESVNYLKLDPTNAVVFANQKMDKREVQIQQVYTKVDFEAVKAETERRKSISGGNLLSKSDNVPYKGKNQPKQKNKKEDQEVKLK